MSTSAPCYRTTDTPPRYVALEGDFVVQVQPSDPTQCASIGYTFAQLQQVQAAKQQCEQSGGNWQPLGPPYGGQCVAASEPLDTAWDWLKSNWWWVLGAAVLIGLLVAALNQKEPTSESMFAIFPVAERTTRTTRTNARSRKVNTKRRR